MSKRLLLCAAFTCFGSLSLAESASTPSTEQAMRAVQASFPEYWELLSLPNDAAVPADVQKNAQWLEAAFRKRGFTTRQLPNAGKPLVYAELVNQPAQAKTVLFYMHFDGQPVLPEQWAQKSPWQPVVKQRNAAGKWDVVDTTRLQATPLDPELRVFGRSSSDDKGPIMMFLAAFDALKAAGMESRVRVKVLLDSEEEKGSPTIGQVVKQNKDLLKADVLLIHDGPMHASNRSTLIFGNRGNTIVSLTVYGPKSPLHSGHYGNFIPNPAQRLASLLGSMKDDDGRVTIPGYYDRIKLSDAEKRILAAVPDDEAAIRARAGVARTEKVGANYQEALQYPSLNIRGMQAAAIGDKGANIVPKQATAELDLRTTPETPPDYLVHLIEAHVRSRGYYLVQGEPTDAERAVHDKIASIVLGRGSQAAYTRMDSAEGAWTYAALKQASGDEPVRIRMMGGSVPTDKLVEELGVPFLIVPLVNSDNNQHSYDENLRVGHYLAGVRTLFTLLRSE
ncbi:MAG: acetylornithine deacetylase [Ramlibacter sp.]|nr:acetylornithine deacetylase [Ramlibacter sp.]